jgi:hypothetical protein
MRLTTSMFFTMLAFAVIASSAALADPPAKTITALGVDNQSGNGRSWYYPGVPRFLLMVRLNAGAKCGVRTSGTNLETGLSYTQITTVPDGSFPTLGYFLDVTAFLDTKDAAPGHWHIDCKARRRAAVGTTYRLAKAARRRTSSSTRR